MNRRQALLVIAGAGSGLAGYALHERRGLTRGDFPSQDSDASANSSLSAPVRSILSYAALAPSGHNAQPWHVRVGDDQLQIGSDHSRWLPSVDPANRELALSIGAFVENLLVASPSRGYVADYEVTGTTASDSDLVRIRLTKTAAKPDSLARLRSRTLRAGHLSEPLSSSDSKSLTAPFDGAAHFIGPTSREGRYIAEGTIEANRAQALRNDAQEELAKWIRWSDAEARDHRDGLTQESMEIAGVAGWYVRHFMNHATVVSKSFRDQGVERVRQQVAACGGWIVVTSPDSTLRSLIESGRQTERMWLGVRDRSIAVHPMTQMLEESPFRDAIARDLGIPSPIQFLLRVGYVERYPEPVSIRRPVVAFIEN
jgi:hypothetical protein